MQSLGEHHQDIVVDSSREKVRKIFVSPNESLVSKKCFDPAELKYVHPDLLRMFPNFKQENFSNAGKIRLFAQNWRKLTSDPHIMEIVEGWKLPLKSRPHQVREPGVISMSQKEQEVIDLEIQSMLQKEVIQIAEPSTDQFVSNIFVRPKKGEDKYRPIINLKSLNKQMPYIHFKMEGMKNVVDLLNQGNYMVKIDLKEAYWHIPIHPASRKYLRF